jgi:hypothetical protein
MSAFGSFAWYPSVNFLPFTNISGSETFVGIEISTRYYVNINLKIGQEIFNGNYNFLAEKVDSGNNTFNSIPFKLSSFNVTIGFSLWNQTKPNNILRLWDKSLISNY